MASITLYPFFRHLRAEPNQFILFYREGRLSRSGAGLSVWFNPLSASAAQVPLEDCETTFLLQERTLDFQEISVQCTLTYRIVDSARAAARINFAISLRTGAWLEQPLERLANLWSQRAMQAARSHITSMPIDAALRSGAEQIRQAILDALVTDPDLQSMGLALVSVLITRIVPNPELEKALQTPTREAIQQKADQALFERRALAVEKERAIKENELSTEIELARRQEQLIEQQGANALRTARQEAQTERERTVAEAERRTLEAQARAEGERLIEASRLVSEQQRLTVWRDLPGRVLLGLVMQQYASKIKTINHLNLSPDLLGETLQQFLRDQADK